jgi:subtilisin family serine protease
LTDEQPGAPWGLDRVDQRALPLSTTYSYDTNGSGVDAYIVDSGIRSGHREFTGRIVRGMYVDFGDATGIEDCNGHGTHVAGTIGGTTFGVAKGASLIPVKVFACNGRTTTSAVIAGLDWIISDHTAGVPAVANMSLGGPASGALDAAVNAVIADGVTVVVAAGNE